MKGLLWFLLLAFLGAASVIKPDFNAHQKMIYETATGASAPPPAELAALPEWQGLIFRDVYFGTATQSKERKSIVTYGFFRHVTVMDKSWWANPFGKQPEHAQ